LSRSPFAERFTRLVGVPPITYLTDWRMQLAAARLRDTPRPIARIADELGYESEATFTRAFKRAMGVAPGRFRRGNQAPLRGVALDRSLSARARMTASGLADIGCGLRRGARGRARSRRS
jgi:AraC-like DNA-binding protein